MTDLLNPTKARRTPIEQRTKPIKTRGLKKADREADCFFISDYLKLCERTLSFAVSLRLTFAIQFRTEPGTFLKRRFAQRPQFG